MTSKTTETDKNKAKEEDFIGPLKIHYNELAKENEKFIVQTANSTLKAFFKGEKNYYHEIAEMIKKEIDEHLGGTWHVFVGKSFGSFVTHETKNICYFFIGQVGFLIFKHG